LQGPLTGDFPLERPSDPPWTYLGAGPADVK